MENLDRMTAGPSYFESNTQALDEVEWEITTLNQKRSEWPVTLTAYVNLISTLPHAASVFWGTELCMIHNVAWGTEMAKDGLQGHDAANCFSGEGLGSLQSSLKGCTVKMSREFLLDQVPHHEPQAPILLAPLFDSEGNKLGVLAQLMHNVGVEKPLDDILQDDYTRDERVGRKDEKDDDRNMTEINVNAGSKKSPDRSRKINLKENRLFRRFAQILPTGLAVLDEQAEALFVNDDFYRLTTRTSQKTFRAWPESIHPEDHKAIMAKYREAIKENKEMRVEFRCADETYGQNVPWRVLIMRPLDDVPDRSGFICVVMDITEMKAAVQAQREIAEEAKERRKQQESFIDMVSHEIRNPLSAILHSAGEINECCKYLKSQGVSGDDSEVASIGEAADTILLCAAHQNSLVDDILSFSKLDASMLTLTPKSVKPASGFGDSCRLFASEMKSKNIEFDYALDISYEELGIDAVVADIKRLRQVLVNLLSNAIKFISRKDGQRKITVSIGATKDRPTSYPPNVVFFESDHERSKIDSTNSQEWGDGEPLYLMLSVSDTGIGMSEEEQKELFRKFRQATPRTQEKYGGSGLGLFISRKLCHLHGGEIGVSSTYGKGSTFGFYFKVKRTNQPAEPVDSSAAATEPSKTDSRDTAPKDKEGAPVKAKDNSMFSNPRVEYRENVHPGDGDTRSQQTKNISDEVSNGGEKSAKDPRSDTPPSTGRPTPEHGDNEKHVDRPTQLFLVEDNEINARVLARSLKKKGYSVLTAHNGQEAIDMFKRISSDIATSQQGDNQRTGPNRVVPDAFDCILMDQEMPIKGGNEAAQEIRTFNDHIPILGISANAREEQVQSMLDAGMNEVISKPFKVEDLVKRIQGLLSDRTYDGSNDNGSEHDTGYSSSQDTDRKDSKVGE